MSKRKRPDNMGKNSGEKAKVFAGINGKERGKILANLKEQDELRQKIATPLIDQGMDTSVNASWPEILEALRQHLISSFSLHKSFYEEKKIYIPDSKTNIRQAVTSCIHLMNTLEFMARSGELWSRNMISPIRVFVELAFYWRNRFLRGLENKTPDKAHNYVSEAHKKEARACFEEMIGLPFEAISELHRQIDAISILAKE